MRAHDFPQEFMTEAAKGAPPVAVAAATIMGAVDWQMWVLILTAAYVVLQIVWLLWRFADKAMGKNTDDD